MLRDTASRHGILVRSELDPALPTTTADCVQPQQVLVNLMLNGIEAMADGSAELSVASRRTDDGQLLISVSDSGIGNIRREPQTHFRGVLHHETAGNRYGTVHQSQDYRVPWRSTVGQRQYWTGCDLSVHVAQRTAPHLSRISGLATDNRRLLDAGAESVAPTQR